VASELTTALGLVAGVLTTACWVPQIVRAARTHSTGDLSWHSLLALGSGIALWIAYGAVLADPAIMAANSASFLALLTLGRLKRRFDQVVE